jgi:hypothetical protein
MSLKPSLMLWILHHGFGDAPIEEVAAFLLGLLAISSRFIKAPDESLIGRAADERRPREREYTKFEKMNIRYEKLNRRRDKKRAEILTLLKSEG